MNAPDSEHRSEPRSNIWVQKFGGTSVATPALMRNAVERIREHVDRGHRLVVVVSAMGKTTDRLLELAYDLSSTPPRRELDMLMSAGEIQSMALLVMALCDAEISAVSLTGAQCGILTDAQHSRARIREIDAERVHTSLEAHDVVVVAGFQGVTAGAEITTLGRGGSDTSAVALAAVLAADCCEILTDVPGVFTANPRTVPNARHIDELSYDEMLEMATLGASVLHNRSVGIAHRYRVPLIVASATKRTPGTRIVPSKVRTMEAPIVRAVTEDATVSKISLLKVPDVPGIAGKVFATLGDAGITVRLVVQAQSHAGANDITLIVPSDLPVSASTLDAVVEAVGGESYILDHEVGLLSVVGEGIAGDTKLVGSIFSRLAEQGINIDLISSANLVISCVVPQSKLDLGARVLHRALIEGDDIADQTTS